MVKVIETLYQLNTVTLPIHILKVKIQRVKNLLFYELCEFDFEPFNADKKVSSFNQFFVVYERRRYL